jgi:hypothetical protein
MPVHKTAVENSVFRYNFMFVCITIGARVSWSLILAVHLSVKRKWNIFYPSHLPGRLFVIFIPEKLHISR